MRCFVTYRNGNCYQMRTLWVSSGSDPQIAREIDRLTALGRTEVEVRFW
jgi:hypothetical protein